MFKIQRLQYGVGPWVDDVVGSWSAPAGTAGRTWTPGLTGADAADRVAANDRTRARGNGGRVPPRRAVPVGHPSGVWE